jgi:hypothetical protein
MVFPPPAVRSPERATATDSGFDGLSKGEEPGTHSFLLLAER